MGSGLILETTFLVDLERELLRGEGGAATRWLEQHPEDDLYLTFTIAGELANFNFQMVAADQDPAPRSHASSPPSHHRSALSRPLDTALGWGKTSYRR